MKARIISLVLAVIAANVGLAQEAGHSNPASNTQPAKPAFLVIYKPGPGWLAGKPLAQQPLGEHGKYMLSLYSQGALKIAGPFTDDSGGAVLLQAPGLGEAQNIVTKDPAVVSGVFVYELHPWGLVDWDARMKK